MTREDISGWRPDPQRETSILFDAFVLGQRARALVAAALRHVDLRPDEYAVYSVVFEAGSVTLTEMAHRLGMPLTTVADYVRSMQGRGHARKERRPTDQRSSLLSLTPEGLRAHREASLAFDRAYRSLLAELTVPEDGARKVLQGLARSAERALDSLQEGQTTQTG